MNTTQTRESILFLGEIEPEEIHIAEIEDSGLDWALHDGLDFDNAVACIREASYVVSNNIDLNRYANVLRHPRLTVVAATGFSSLDLDRLRTAGARVSNLESYCTDAVTDYLLWGTISGLRRMHAAVGRVAGGDWRKDFYLGADIRGRRFGVLGFGEIGSSACRAIECLGGIVKHCRRSKTESDDSCLVDPRDLFRDSDVILVCCSANDSSARLVDKELLKLCKRNVVLVSVSPNEVLDLRALASFFRSNPAASAVLDLDPISQSHPLLYCENVRVTPHIAFLTRQSLRNRVDGCLELIFNDIRGSAVRTVT